MYKYTRWKLELLHIKNIKILLPSLELHFVQLGNKKRRTEYNGTNISCLSAQSLKRSQ